MAVSRKAVSDAVTPEIRLEFTDLISALAATGDREDRVKLYAATTSAFPDETKKVVNLLYIKERTHVKHVNQTLAQIQEYPTGRKPHDFSKDEMYFFITSSKFDCKVEGEDMEKVFKLETQRHYELEPHHPEYEDIHKKECTDVDILEMSIDRMSRSIQTIGKVDIDDMKKYTPSFPLGDNKRKQDYFMQCVLKYTEVSEREYAKLSCG